MRKLFSILAAVLVSVAMQAKVMTTNIYGGSLPLTGAEFQPRNESFFAVGQTLRFTFEKGEYGWMQAYHKDGADGYKGTNILKDKDLSTGVVEVVLSETAVAQIRDYYGLYIKGEDVTLKSLDLIYDDGDEPEKDATVIWEGEVTAPKDEVSSETAIIAPNFSAAKAGDIVRFTFSNVVGASYYQMSVRTQNASWKTSHQYLNYDGVTAPTAEITLLADDLEDLKARGLYFFGKNVTITKAELLQHACIASELWTGTLTSESGNIEINKSSFFTVVAGDKLRFTFENTRDSYQQLSVWVKNENDEKQYYMNYGEIDGKSQIFTLELPDDGLDYLKQKGLFVSCKNVDLTKVELLREKATESVTIIDNTNSELLLKNIKNRIVDITISRTLYRDGYFNTLCLPFDLSAEQIAASELSSAEIMEFTNAYISGEGDEQTLDLRFDPVSQIEAGKPYLIRFPDTEEDLSSIAFNSVIATKDPSDEPITIDGTSMDFVGILAPTHLSSSNNLFLGANDELYWMNENDETSLNGFRAYFVAPAAARSMVRGKKARIVMRENAPTGLSDVQTTVRGTKVMKDGQLFIIYEGKTYNAQGQTIR